MEQRSQELQLGRSPTIAELAQAAGVETEEATAAILAGKAHTAVSLSAPAPNDPDTELGDTLADPDAVFSAADDRDFIARGSSLFRRGNAGSSSCASSAS